MLNEVRLRELAREAAERSGAAMGPRRERGLWSFLTWSFFLSQLAAGSAFASGAAQTGSNTTDMSAPEGSSQATATAASFHATPDFRVEAASEAQPEAASSGAASVGMDAIHAADKAGGIERLDFTSDAGLDLQSATYSAGMASTAPAAVSDGVAIDAPRDVEAVTDLPQIVELPPLLSEVLPPVIGTIDNIVDDLGSTLDDLFVPVVGTVEDLADALAPTLDDILSPVQGLTDGLVDGLESALAPGLSTIAGLTEDLGDFLAPVVGTAGDIIGLADPVFDIADSLLAPVTNIVEAAQPLLDPVVEIAAPVVDLIDDVTEPLLEPLAPVAQPLLDILPQGLGNDGPLGNLFGGNNQTDAVGSPGGIAFAAEVEMAGYDLMEAGAYTELGITLHDTTLDVDSDAVELVGNVAEPVTDLIDDAHDGNVLPSLLGSLQHEVALRGLGEGLI